MDYATVKEENLKLIAQFNRVTNQSKAEDALLVEDSQNLERKQWDCLQLEDVKNGYLRQIDVVKRSTDKRIKDLKDSLNELNSLEGKPNIESTQVHGLPQSDTLEYQIQQLIVNDKVNLIVEFKKPYELLEIEDSLGEDKQTVTLKGYGSIDPLQFQHTAKLAQKVNSRSSSKFEENRFIIIYQ